jgi:cytochrome c5
MSEVHSSPIKTPGQLITVVVLAFVVPVALLVMVVQIVTAGLKVDRDSSAMSDAAVAARLKPVGEVALGSAGTAIAERSGEEIYKQACQACHGAGLLNAPKPGDQAAWKARIAQGQKTLIEHAINGIRTMPPKGGNTALSDRDVARAATWMANQSGAKFKEPAGATTANAQSPATQAPASAAAQPAASPAPLTQAAAPASDKVDGAQVYQSTCAMCHTPGLAGAPKLGDQGAWKPRVAQGMKTLHEHAVKGIRTMPPKGGNLTLSDAAVSAAVDYMVKQSK